MTGPTPSRGPTRFDGARWCEEHGQRECAKPRSKGRGTCHGKAIVGTDTCRMHAGVSSEMAKAQGQARITAFSALGGTPSMDPGLAVLASLHMSWLRVHLYASLLEQQVEGEQDSPVGGWDEATPGGADTQPSASGIAGLIGHTFAADKQAGIFAASESQRALVALEAQERDRVVRYAKTAHDMGIAEREVRLAESQGQLLATVVRNILGDLDLSPVQQGLAPAAIQRRFREAAVGELEQGGAA